MNFVHSKKMLSFSRGFKEAFSGNVNVIGRHQMKVVKKKEVLSVVLFLISSAFEKKKEVKRVFRKLLMWMSSIPKHFHVHRRNFCLKQRIGYVPKTRWSCFLKRLSSEFCRHSKFILFPFNIEKKWSEIENVIIWSSPFEAFSSFFSSSWFENKWVWNDRFVADRRLNQRFIAVNFFPTQFFRPRKKRKVLKFVLKSSC